MSTRRVRMLIAAVLAAVGVTSVLSTTWQALALPLVFISVFLIAWEASGGAQRRQPARPTVGDGHGGEGMKLYVVLVDDRHQEPTGYVFSTPELAVEYARRHWEENVPDDMDQAEMVDAGIGEQVPAEGWLYHGVYSTEGDAVWVYETRLDVPEWVYDPTEE